jgi:hypothetical protein
MYALPLSAGFGLDFGFDHTKITAEKTGGLGYKGQLSYTPLNYGFFGFFDATYIDVKFGITGVTTWVKTTAAVSNSNGGVDPENIRLYGNALTLSFYGKYPFELNSFTIYPILGIEFKIMLSLLYDQDSPEEYDHRKKGDSYQGKAKDWTAFYGRLGVGFDFNVSDSFFIRSEVTFGIKPSTARENFIIDNLVNSQEFSEVNHYGLGLKVTVALGFSVGELSGGRGGYRGGGGSYGGGRGGGNDIYYPR